MTERQRRAWSLALVFGCTACAAPRPAMEPAPPAAPGTQQTVVGSEPTVPETDAGCRASAECRELGLCVYDTGHHKCVAGSDEDCARSEVCRNEGRCRAGAACPPTDPCADMEGAHCVK